MDGFGHYYKFGNVKRQYQQLDVLIRSLVRRSLAREGHTGRIYNDDLARLGLHSLTAIRERCLGRDDAEPAKLRPIRSQRSSSTTTAEDETSALNEELVVLLRRIDRKLTQLVSGQSTLNATVERLCRGY